MHELGVTFHIMDHLEKVAKENQVTHIHSVTLELGEVSTVIESYLQNCWTWAAKKRPLFADAKLIVETLSSCGSPSMPLPTAKTAGKPMIRCPRARSAPIAAARGRIFCRAVNSTLRK